MRNRNPSLLVNPKFCVVVVTIVVALRCQLRAALGAAALENESPSLGGHAGTETVGSCALDFAGLKGAFHDDYLDH